MLRLRLALLLVAAAATAHASGVSSSATPATEPPGQRLLTQWIGAVSSGDRGSIHSFIRENFASPPGAELPIGSLVDNDFTLYGTSRGLKLRRVLDSSPDSIKALLQTRLAGNWMEATLFFNDADPPKIAGMGISSIGAPLDELPRKKLTDREIAERGERLLNRMGDADAFSGVVIVARGGKPIFAHASGLASQAWNQRNQLDTRFNLASITKMFTAVSIAQLVEQGSFSYDDTVGKILPDYPNRDVADHVTIRQLLSHTSGMIDAQELADKTPPSAKIRTIDGMLATFADEPLAFPPGQQMQYSNAGYVLLGAIIEKVTGQTYFNYVHAHVFKPAEMTGADFVELDADPPRIATGYKDNPLDGRQSNIFDLDAVGSPAAMAYATADDLVRFHQALMSGKLVKRESLDVLWTGVTEARDGTQYGLGSQLDSYNGVRIVGHGGGWKGVTNRFEMYPDLDTTVVILSNYDCDPIGVANRFREWITERPDTETPLAEAPPVVKVTAKAALDTVAVGQPVTVAVIATNAGGPLHQGIVDFEIKDEAGKKSYQRFAAGQLLTADNPRTYAYSWIPETPGTYKLAAGVFGPGWSQNHAFVEDAATITVTSR